MIYVFADFELDEQRWELRKKGRPLEIAPKALEIALHLVKNRDRVVSKDELLDVVWKGLSVSEASLSVSIFALRQLLGDDGQRQEYVKTARSRGYRFVANVTELGARSEVQATAHDGPSEPAREPAREFFVDRSTELTVLNAGFERAMAGGAGVFLVPGEPGIGKTCLVEEFAERVQQRGARVIWGWCCEGGGAPELWPWMRLLRCLYDVVDGGAPAHSVPPLIANVLKRRSGREEPEFELPLVPFFQGERTRFELFQAVCQAIQSASQLKPLLLIIEDLHAVDSTSLNLLSFLARELRRARVLIVGTYRPDDVSPESQNARLFRELIGGAALVPLGGMSESQIALLAEARFGRSLELELVRTIHAATEGNPLFVGELLQLVPQHVPITGERLATSLKIPARITEAIRKRVNGLPSTAQRLLASGAVLGREFHLRIIERVSDLSGSELLDALDAAFSRRLIDEAPMPGEYCFTHGLFRAVIYEDLGVRARAELHQRAGVALEEARAFLATSSAQLAHHFLKASCIGQQHKALAYSLEAAQQAFAAFAYDEAATHYSNSIEALSVEEDVEARVCELLLAQGYAEKAAGYYARAASTFARAAELARRLGKQLEFCRAALGQVHARPETGRADPEVIELLEETIAVLEQLPAAEAHTQELMAVAKARLALTLAFSARPETIDELSKTGLELARRFGSPETVVYALHARHWALWGPDTLRQRCALVAEMLELEPVLTDGERVRQARACQVTDLMELGDGRRLDEALAACKRNALAFQDPIAEWDAKLFETMKLLATGFFSAAERLASQALIEGKRWHEQNAIRYTTTQLTWLRLEQGRGAELEPALRKKIDEFPSWLAARCTLLRLYVELERTHDVRREFEESCKTPLSEIPKWTLLPCLAHLVSACALLGDRRRARLLHDELLPYAGQHVVQGPAIVYLGPVNFYLGLLTRCLDQLDDSYARFAQALEECTALSARPAGARARHELASTLARRGTRGDFERALATNAVALSTASELGMEALEERCLGLQDRLRGLALEPALESTRLARN